MTTTLRHTAARLLAATLVLLAAACGEKEEIFYTARYDILRVEALVEQTAPEPGDGSDDATPPADDETLARLAAEVVAASPVAAGGSYTLDFDRYDGGPLTLVAAPGAEPLRGSFTKQPGADSLRFDFPEGVVAPYTLRIGSYADEGAGTCVCLEADLTEDYRERYPALELVRVVRRELTSTPYR